MFRRFICITTVLILLLLLSDSMPAQNNRIDSLGVFTGIDSTYIADYTDKLTARLYLLYQDASFVLNPENIDELLYKPNVNVRLGIAGFYKWFGLGLSINNPFYKRNDATYGKTTVVDLRVNAFGRSVAAELYFQQYSGFYIQNIKKADGSCYVIPDMKTVSIGAAGYWILNASRFSFRAAFVQNERQLKSAGSFMVRPSITYYRLNSDQGIIPGEIIHDYHLRDNEKVISGKFTSVGLAPGYSYTFVFLKNVYINLAVFPGVYWQYYSYQTSKMEHNKGEFSFQLDSRLAVGYNSDKWFIGGAIITGFDEITTNLSNSLFYYDVAQVRIWGGARFDLFRKKKKNY